MPTYNSKVFGRNDRYSPEFREVTPLWVATYENNLDVVKYLARKGAHIETTDGTNRRIELHMAVGKGNLEMVKCLVEECGADIQQQGIWKNDRYSLEFRQVTPLWVATYKNNLDVIKYLVSKGAGIETSDACTDRISELHIAVREKQLRDCEMLGGGVWCRHTTARYLEPWSLLSGVSTSHTGVGSNTRK